MATGLLLAWAPSDRQVFRAGIDVVLVSVTVKDHDGRLITGLTRDDFTVYEDGIAQTLSYFTSERLPVSLGILVDVSDSMYGQRIADARRAIDRFVVDLLDAEDEAFLMTFNHGWELLARWTRPPKALAGRLEAVRPFGSTALYDALAAAGRQIPRRRHQRCGIVVISDGADTASESGSVDARAALLRADAFVYAIAIDAPPDVGVRRVFSPHALGEMTGAAGGYTEVIRDGSELGAATERIATELNNQYTLAYSPPHRADGRFHTIRVDAANRDLVVRARRGYFAVE
ncbi:MAG: VWA domain-containing protein [Vicinamibacterales bacterium]